MRQSNNNCSSTISDFWQKLLKTHNNAIQWLLMLVVLLLNVDLEAHEIRPAYWQINQITANEYDVLWKVPAIDNKILKIKPQFPEDFQTEKITSELLGDALLERYKGSFNEPLAGQELSVLQQEKTLVDVLVKIDLLNGDSYTFLLQPKAPTVTIPASSNLWQVVTLYLKLGVEHILLGIDHLLFVLGLLLLVSSTRLLIQTITAFTIAHSITLGLASFQLMSLPSAPVEAVIALSIIFLAKEYIDFKNGKKNLTSQYPWIVAFSFGLLHGFGFAGALQEIGFPQSNIFVALLTFNIGVELGQLIFIGIILVISLFLNRIIHLFPSWYWKIIPYIIGSIASFWFIERVIRFVH